MRFSGVTGLCQGYIQLDYIIDASGSKIEINSRGDFIVLIQPCQMFGKCAAYKLACGKRCRYGHEIVICTAVVTSLQLNMCYVYLYEDRTCFEDFHLHRGGRVVVEVQSGMDL